MAYTRHGHHVPNTVKGDDRPPSVKRCGGVKMCTTCIQDVENHFLRFAGEPTDYPAKAKKLVDEHVSRRLRAFMVGKADIPAYEVYVESCTYTLGNYKAWVGTTLDDKLMYQVTYDAVKRVTYLNEYRNLANICIPD